MGKKGDKSNDDPLPLIRDIITKDGKVPSIKEIKQVNRELIEKGYYERYILTGKDGKTHQGTTRFPPNPAKVTLARCGMLEYSVYPYSFPDMVFVHLTGEKTQIDRYDVNRHFSAINKVRWYLFGGCKNAISGKSKTQLAKDIKLAYEYSVSKELGQ